MMNWTVPEMQKRGASNPAFEVVVDTGLEPVTPGM